FGDALMEVRKADLHNRHDLICVTMAFDTTPWYGNNPRNPAIRHADYITDVVLPLIEKHYPVKPAPESRLLLGFSKSGWGAFSLLLRNPDVFGYACSWDAPLVMDEDDFKLWGVDRHFGSKENFMAYSPLTLAKKNADVFRDGPARLVLLGHQFFGSRWATSKDAPHTAAFYQKLQKLDIPHAYNNKLPAAHSWNPKWLVPAVERLMDTANAEKNK
ncbi:MAG: alpha/beta hydrolase-fold protein, partial [bacterium]